MAQLSSLCKQKRFLKEDFYKRQFCFPFRFHICNGEDALNSLPIYQLCYFGLQCCFSCYLHYIFLESIVEVKELCPKTGSCFYHVFHFFHCFKLVYLGKELDLLYFPHLPVCVFVCSGLKRLSQKLHFWYYTFELFACKWQNCMKLIPMNIMILQFFWQHLYCSAENFKLPWRRPGKIA